MKITRRFEATILKSQLLAPIFRNWENIQLKDCWLVAGCVAQTIWNDKFALPLEFGISDIDLIYFDSSDLSERSEQRHAQRIRQSFDQLPVWIDVKNEARVHCWYEKKFGYPIEPYQSVEAAISTFPTTATAVGVRPSGNGLEVHSTYGLDDLLGGIVRPNKVQVSQGDFEAKANKWIKKWPDLTVLNW